MTVTGTRPASVLSAGGYTVLPGGRVRVPGGLTVDLATAQRAWGATPAATRRARTSRAGLFVRWCNDHGRVHTDPGALADWANWLADRKHPADTIAGYTATVIERLATDSGVIVSDAERALIRGVIDARALEEAADPDGTGDALQATECTRADLRAMLATIDRSTLVGLRDALVLCLDWYMAGRASEPGALGLRDVEITTAPLLDRAGRRRKALVLTLRRSKTNAYGRTTDTVRLLAQDDETCPVAACEAWTAALAALGVTSGPLLRRIKDGKLTTAGRPPKDPNTPRGGIGHRTVRDLIADRARAAGLVRELTADERDTLSVLAERRELAAAADDAEREAIRIRRRLARRRLRRTLPRYSGHSMRRGWVRHAQRRGTRRDIIERHARYAPGSKALARYLLDLVDWDDNPTAPAATEAAATVSG